MSDFNSSDSISRQAAIDALWKALFEYEDETEKQFQESEDLDIRDWIGHRIFVQNMNDIDRRTILDLPSAQPEIVMCKDCRHGVDYYHEGDCYCSNPKWGLTYFGGSWEFYCADAKRKSDRGIEE